MFDNMMKYWEGLHDLTKINDLTTRYTETLFIVESPHVSELNTRIPLTGASGKAVSRILFKGEISEPFGSYVFSRQIDDPFYKVGILNVSQLPLQSKPYTMHEREKYAGFIFLLNLFRDEWNKSYFTDPRLSDIESVMVDKFSKRILSLPSLKTVIPCGKFAQHYFGFLEEYLPIGSEVVRNIPHPSQGLWDKEPDYYRQKILPFMEEPLIDEI